MRQAFLVQTHSVSANFLISACSHAIIAVLLFRTIWTPVARDRDFEQRLMKSVRSILGQHAESAS